MFLGDFDDVDCVFNHTHVGDSDCESDGDDDDSCDDDESEDDQYH